MASAITEKGKKMKFYKTGELQDKKIASALRQAVDDFENGELIEVRDVLQDIVDAINEKTDALDVVFCRECVYWAKAKSNKKGFLICPASGMEIMADDFCSYGERRTNEVD